MCCRCCSVRQQKIWVFTLGALFVVIGIVLITAWPTIADSIIRAKLVLTPKSYTFSKWEVTPIPLYLTFYLYNWTNPHEINNPNVKPHFEEHGPYAFRDIKVKEDLQWHDENSTVTFYGRRTWYFDAEKSNGKLDDLITSPHFPTVGGAKISRKMHKIFRKIANFGLNREGGRLTVTQTAINWIFDGFYDDIFDFVERLHSPLFPLYSNTFAWFYERNNSKEAEGTYTIHTGKSDLSQMGDLKLWNGSDHTGYWEGECGRVNGSTGELFSPYKSWDESISIFIMDAARYINLFPKEKTTYRGVEAWLYTSTDQTFDSGYIAPDTKCFCVKGNECPKNGVIDYSTVTYQSPVYISHPHFYMADPLYLENTTGLKPDAEKHGIYALLEPTLGVPLDMNGQVMISVLVEQDEYVDILRDVAHNFYAPLFTIQIKADISDDIFRFVKFALSVPDIGFYSGIGLLVLGVIMITLGIWLTKAHKWRGDVIEMKEKVEAVEKNEIEETQWRGDVIEIEQNIEASEQNGIKETKWRGDVIEIEQKVETFEENGIEETKVERLTTFSTKELQQTTSVSEWKIEESRTVSY